MSVDHLVDEDSQYVQDQLAELEAALLVELGDRQKRTRLTKHIGDHIEYGNVRVGQLLKYADTHDVFEAIVVSDHSESQRPTWDFERKDGGASE